jgi:hypothetical protein
LSVMGRSSCAGLARPTSLPQSSRRCQRPPRIAPGTRALVTLAGPLALVFLYPTGRDFTGIAPSYWADVVVPSVLAVWPLAFAVLPTAAEPLEGGMPTRA